MKEAYLETIGLVERLHRQFLEVVKGELERLGVRDVNNVQALLLFNIGDEDLTVGELTQRGYYLGTNVTYNLKKLVEHGYVEQNRSVHDRRSVRVKLSDKGGELRAALDQVFDRHVGALEATGDEALDALKSASEGLKALGRFWGAASGFGTGVDRAA